MRTPLRIALGIALTAALVAIIVAFVPVERVREALRSFDPVWLAPLVACYALTFACRAARFRALGIPLGFGAMYGVVSAYQFLVRVLPLRSGEAALPVLVKRLCGASLAHGFAAIALSHLLDLAALALAALLALLAAPDVRATIGPVWTTLIGVGLVAMVLGYFFLPATAGAVASRLARRLRAKRPGAADRLDGIAHTLGEIRSISHRVAGLAAVWTALAWVAAVGTFWSAAESIGITVGPARVVLGSAAAVLAGVLPVSGVGTFGAFEGAWAGGFVLVGVPSGPAVASALVMSAATFLYAGAAAGAFAWIRLRAGRGETAAPPVASKDAT